MKINCLEICIVGGSITGINIKLLLRILTSLENVIQTLKGHLILLH